MSLQDLQSILQAQVDARNSISLDAATLRQAELTAAADFDLRVQTPLVLVAPPTIAVTGSISPPNGNALSIRGTGSFLGLQSVPAVVTFTVDDQNDVTMVMLVTLPVGWTFGASFSLLAGFPFSELLLTQSIFVLATTAQPGYSWEGRMVPLAQGLNFAAFLGTSGPLTVLHGLITGLLSDTSTILAGTVDNTGITNLAAAMPVLDLTATIAHPSDGQSHYDLTLPTILLASAR